MHIEQATIMRVVVQLCWYGVNADGWSKERCENQVKRQERFQKKIQQRVETTIANKKPMSHERKTIRKRTTTTIVQVEIAE